MAETEIPGAGCETEIDSAVLDVDKLMEHVGGDGEMIEELADLFLSYCPELLVDLAAAVDRQELDPAREIVHRLKGALSNFHAPQALSVARDLENAARDGFVEKTAPLCRQLSLEMDRFRVALNLLVARCQAQN